MFLVALSVLPWLVFLFYRYPLLLLCLFPVISVFDVFFPFFPFVVSGYWLLPMDFVYFFMAMHLGICLLRQPSKVIGALTDNIFLTIFLALVAVYVVIYTPTNGQSAVGEARKYYGMFLFPLFALVSLKRPEDLRRFMQVVILSATAIVIVALGMAAQEGTIARIISSDGALFITFAALAMAVYRIRDVAVISRKLDRVLLAVFAVLAVGLAHRTVWLTAGYGSLLLIWLYNGRPRLMLKLTVVALVLVAACGAGLIYFPEAGSQLAVRFKGIIDPYSDSTASWRIEGWQFQLDELQKSGQLLFGDGLGGYYSWKSTTGGEVTVSPHNAYVQTVLKFGLFGLAIYGLLALKFFRTTSVFRKQLSPGPLRANVEIGIVNFGAAHAYMLGYGIVPIIFAFFAAAVCAIKLSKEFPKVTTQFPARAGILKRNRRVASMPLRRAPATRYAR